MTGSAAHDTPTPEEVVCPRCEGVMGTVLFGIQGDPFCVACLEPDGAIEDRAEDAAGGEGMP